MINFTLKSSKKGDVGESYSGVASTVPLCLKKKTHTKLQLREVYLANEQPKQLHASNLPALPLGKSCSRGHYDERPEFVIPSGLPSSHVPLIMLSVNLVFNHMFYFINSSY